MATGPRIFELGGYYHVYNRGNRKAAIFRTSEDYARFLVKLDEYSRRDGVGLVAWCLMPNHYHLILRQDKDGAIERTMRSIGTSTAKYYNWQYGSVGHLCQERYQMRRVLNEPDLLNLSSYIHAKPKAIDNYKNYRWSSYRQYVRRTIARPEVVAMLETLEISSEQYAVYLDGYMFSKHSANILAESSTDL